MIKIKTYETIKIIGFALLMVFMTFLLSTSLSLFLSFGLGLGISSLMNTIAFGIAVVIFQVIGPCLYIKLEGANYVKELKLGICKENKSIIVKCISIICFICIICLFFHMYGGRTTVMQMGLFLTISIGEEVLARGFVFSKTQKVFNALLAIIITSLIFAVLMHSAGGIFTNIFIRSPISIFLTYITYKTGDLYSAIFLHTAYNLCLLCITI